MEGFVFQTQTEKRNENFCGSLTSAAAVSTPLMEEDMKIDSCSKDTESNFEEVSEEIHLRDLPYIPREQLFERDFSLRQPTNIEVTSVDVASHGCFVICGCSNGQVLLFDLSKPSPSTASTKSTTSITFQQPQLIGHIKAKGIHTNLLLTVVITEDCRFCFAGVIKGSSELLAIDLGRLPVDPIQPGRKATISIEIRSYSYADTVTFIHSDPKLRGFGAAALVSSSTSVYDQRPKYRLACGRGIKNVHVWQFSPARSAHHLSNFGRLGEDGTAYSPFQCGSDSWVCMYDVATNGNTITGFAFRHGATELLTKSGGSNLRVWNLRSFDPSDADKSSRPAYEDIANTQDTKNIVPGYAFGGTYEFAIVRIDAPKEANRDAFSMPEKVCEEDNGLRRRRTMREVESILSTQDGNHILILCTDGCVMYYPNLLLPSTATDNSAFAPAKPTDSPTNVNIPSSGNSDVNESFNRSSDSDSDSAESDLPVASTTKLQELISLHRDTESDQAWALKRVGRDGDVILVRAYKAKSSVCRLSINLLSCETKGDVKDTSVSPGHNWNTCGYYVENNAGEKVRDEEKVGSVDFGIAVPAHNLEYDLIHRPQKQERELEKPRGRPPRPLLKTARPEPANTLTGSANGYGRGVNSSNAFTTPECDLNTGTSPTVDSDKRPYMHPGSTSLTLTTLSSQSSDTLVKLNLTLDLRTSQSPNVLGGTDSPLLSTLNTNSNPNQQPKKRVAGVKPRSSKRPEEALNSDEEKEKEETASDKISPERDSILSTRSQAASHSTKKSSSSAASYLGSYNGPQSSSHMDETFVVPKRKPLQPLQLKAPPPKVLKVVDSTDVHTATGKYSGASELQSHLTNTFSSWLSKLDSIVPDEIVLGTGVLSGMGPQVQRRLSLQKVEQDRLKAQFLSHTEAYLLKISGDRTSYPIALTALQQHLQEIVTLMIQRQQMELDTAFAMDQCLAGQPFWGPSANVKLKNANFLRKEETRLTVAFRHRYILAELDSLQEQLSNV